MSSPICSPQFGSSVLARVRVLQLVQDVGLPGQGAGPQPLVAELHHGEGVAGAGHVGGSQTAG